MKLQEHNITIKKNARYYSSKPLKDINSVWIAIHGYAQLAKDFIKDFNFLFNEKTLIIAPEGLSKFYFRNKIGASWMTMEDRLNEINDYLYYLEKMMKAIKLEYNLTKSKINLLGFSQGVHTAVRWFTESKYFFDNLLLCSSDFPKDADFEKLKAKLQNSKLYFLHGNNDGIIGNDIFSESKNLLNQNEIVFDDIIFDGGHEISEESLSRFIT